MGRGSRVLWVAQRVWANVAYAVQDHGSERRACLVPRHRAPQWNGLAGVVAVGNSVRAGDVAWLHHRRAQSHADVSLLRRDIAVPGSDARGTALACTGHRAGDAPLGECARWI